MPLLVVDQHSVVLGADALISWFKLIVEVVAVRGKSIGEPKTDGYADGNILRMRVGTAITVCYKKRYRIIAGMRINVRRVFVAWS